MTDPSQRHEPDEPADPFDAARRYGRPAATPPGSVGPAPGQHPEPSAPTPRPYGWYTPTVLSIAGIIGWFLCGWGAIGSVIVGLIAQRKAYELGKPLTLPRVTWIGGIIVNILNAIGLAIYLHH